MPELRTMGDLRKFLAQAMQDVREDKLEQGRAGQIAKLAAQINASVHAEIAARSHLELKNGKAFSSLVIAEGVEQPQIEDVTGKSEYIGEREPGQKLTDADWPDIELMLNKKRYNVTKIAGLYKVEFKEMRDFIDEQQNERFGV